MKRTILAGAMLFLSACSQTASEQLDATYEEMKTIDPKAAAATELAYKHRDRLSDEEKMQIVQIWKELKAGKEAMKAAGR